MSNPGRSWLDHAPALVGTFLVAGYGLIGIAALFVPESPDTIHDGMPGLMFFPIVASLYAAAMLVQLEFGLVRKWQPGLLQGAVVTWVGGWTALLLSGVARQFAVGGLAAARAFSGGAAFLWCLFIGVPWLLAFLRKATRREEYRGFIDE
ncbi:MAG TPA: hypothetical protein VI056_10200 [Candidatus Limnocylindria bacterium]